MNNLKLNVRGGMPVYLEDIDFVNTAIRKGFRDIGKTLLSSADCAILWGCEFTPSVSGYSVSEGSIFYDGEIWSVDQHFMPSPIPLPEEPQWCFVSSPGPLGQKTFYNGEIHNVHLVRKAILSMAPLPDQVGSSYVSNIPKIEHLRNASAPLLPNVSGGVLEREGRRTPNLVRKRDGVVFIDAGYSCNFSGGEQSLITTIPLGFRPLNWIELMLWATTPLPYPNSLTNIWITISPIDGRIMASKMGYPYAHSLGFSINMSYLL